jgi:hypothetical protein
MKRLLTPLAALSLFALACAPRTGSQSASRSADDAEDVREIDQASEQAAGEGASEKASASNDPRQVGDYVTFKFTGSYRKAPLELTRRVVAKDAGSITVDHVFTEKAGTETLRVRTSTEKGTAGEILEVAVVAADGSTQLASKDRFETKIAQTVAVADENEALVGEEPAVVKVDETDVDATRAIYKVRVGKSAATLRTLVSPAFAWGDLGGEIVTADGRVFYKAELTGAGTAAAPTASR